jgi:hypothetical protein
MQLNRAESGARVESRRGPAARHTAATAVALLAFGALSACATGDVSEGVADEAEAALETIGSSAESLSLAAPEYFKLTRDVRRCASPLCGGYFVQAVNRLLTRCANGALSSRCYVAEADFTAAGGEPLIEGNGVVVRGAIQSRVYPDFGDLGRFVASGAWAPVSANAATGAYFRVVDNGIRCITTPCFSQDAELLNTPVTVQISDLDLSRAGASDEELEAAAQALASGELIVAGTLGLRSTGRAVGVALTASQFFLAASERCFSDDDCAAGQSCNAGEVCLPPPGCTPGRVCPAVCTGFCVSSPVSECKTDADCAADSWCRMGESGALGCVPFAAEGQRCDGFTVPWMYERCSPELTCDLPAFVADAPGICRASCKSEAECAADEYCASDGLCHADATCDVAADCLAAGNSYPHILCVGYPVCPGFGEPQQGQCGWSCGNPACVDQAGDFGPCDQVLGWGRVRGACVAISGCDAGSAQLFASQAECDAACPAAP